MQPEHATGVARMDSGLVKGLTLSVGAAICRSDSTPLSSGIIRVPA